MGAPGDRHTGDLSQLRCLALASAGTTHIIISPPSNVPTRSRARHTSWQHGNARHATTWMLGGLRGRVCLSTRPCTPRPPPPSPTSCRAQLPQVLEQGSEAIWVIVQEDGAFAVAWQQAIPQRVKHVAQPAAMHLHAHSRGVGVAGITAGAATGAEAGLMYASHCC